MKMKEHELLNELTKMKENINDILFKLERYNLLVDEMIESLKINTEIKQNAEKSKEQERQELVDRIVEWLMEGGEQNENESM